MNTQKILATLGVPEAYMTTAGQYLYFTPEGTDPDTAGVRVLIGALQNGLRRLGHTNLRPNGVFDEATVRAIDSVSPPRGSWRVKTWVQILGDIVTAMQNPAAQSVRLRALSGYNAQAGLWDDIVDKIAPLGTEAPTVLKWGKNGSTCVPADATTLGAFKALQRQINRLLPLYGGTYIGEDGAVGAQTVTALGRLTAVTGTSLPTCDAVCQVAMAVGAKLALAAAVKGIAPDANTPPQKAPPPPPPAGPIVAGNEAVTPAAKKAMNWSDIKDYLPYVGLAVAAAGVAYFVFKRKPGQRRAVTA